MKAYGKPFRAHTSSYACLLDCKDEFLFVESGIDEKRNSPKKTVSGPIGQWLAIPKQVVGIKK